MTANTSGDAVSRRRIGAAFMTLGALVLLSSLVINPWCGRLYRPDIDNYRDVMILYCQAALAVGAILLVCGILLRGTSVRGIEGPSLLLLVAGLLVLSDRLILAVVGLPLWEADAENHYRHRPNAVRTWGPEFENKRVRINAYGFHDDDFPQEKADGELRGLVIGDSIAMGHGVSADETFANQLEKMLAVGPDGTTACQVINAAVQGYSTYQEYNVLTHSLRFRPDFVIVQFCLNDLTEPFQFDRRFGGRNPPISRITQTPSCITSYLLNETGWGRLVQWIQRRGISLEAERQREVYTVSLAARSPVDDPTIAGGWRLTLSYLDRMYDVAKGDHIRCILLICPHTFQLLDEQSRVPQKILHDHARAREVEVVDVTEIFEELVYDKTAVAKLRAEGFTDDQIEALYQPRLRQYFLDSDHYTAEGHRVVAAALHDRLAPDARRKFP